MAGIESASALASTSSSAASFGAPSDISTYCFSWASDATGAGAACLGNGSWSTTRNVKHAAAAPPIT
ncbi:MAG: hypothetical protein BWX86_02554 [Verrucomicrobia bacterium ADurb.Bin122]|nr:MAG: hypothetical protein BWX86_02554 [Verrucomicrobia bacterium ADurb.Bin122]